MTARTVRNSLVGLVAIVAVAGMAVLIWVWLQPGPTGFASGKPVDLDAYHGRAPTGVPVELARADLLTRGRYLTQAADCEACHTAKGGKPFAGGRPFALPFGTLYTPNITSDKETGIGQWTNADFLRAVHQGVARDGTRLYPAFPYASYTMLTDEDVLAIKAYLFSLQPVHSENLPNTFRFPYDQRWLMFFWSMLFNSNDRFRPVDGQSAEWNRGAYLVEATAHCGECHTPRNAFQALNNRLKFSGGVAEGWNAYNITSDKGTGIGNWTQEELASYLSSGHAMGRGTAGGPMAEAVDLSFRYMTPSDIAAMVTYLKSVPAVKSESIPDHLADAASPVHSSGPGGNPIGKRIFEGACASCHSWTGKGAIRTEAQLTGSRAVNDPSAMNVAQMVLAGTGPGLEDRARMPAFRAIFTDAEVAAVSNYVTARFGSEPSHIDAADVAKLRQQSDAELTARDH
ncbi:cytochrome c [Paraburkholderia sp. USG1]|uniref:cytochrome c n=1 Tax=Paraburkholderia sp. USG1 TaxID=2952268 RepID=UPI0028641BD4|nr:cytochrome c [Paraburkholderia sp. USG1]MDR8401827.1 cytochrome c [Paraburkholderia sp. USG1]